MEGKVRKFRVFVASPGDVARERQVARDVVQTVSHRMGSHGGFALEPVGWETHAGLDAGRPPALINRLVRESDVVVGILWSRFGTQTGVAESGTAEEFAEAQKLRKKTKTRPTMMVFFSDAPVPMERLRDPKGRRQVTTAQKFRALGPRQRARYRAVGARSASGLAARRTVDARRNQPHPCAGGGDPSGRESARRPPAATAQPAGVPAERT